MSSVQQVIMSSSVIQQVFDKAMRIAKFPTTVLIEGESGVGKEVLANWVHYNSPRANLPFVKINCASIPESLLESELFGYERGAFTGAKREGNPGLFELADKGTLLLDEISELTPSMQAKLLRVLQDREVRRVGGSWSRVIDVRVIASTNRNLRDLVREGKFREDLYYRLNVGYLYVPPLRERREDIRPLLEHFILHLSREFNIERKLAQDTLEHLCSYDFPGNVRELRNLLEGLCVTIDGTVISIDDLPPYIRGINRSGENAEEVDTQSPSLIKQVETYERNVIVEALREESSIRSAAKKLGVYHSTLIRKMQKYGIQEN